MKGSIERWVEDRGFGFIKYGEGEEVFFHGSECSKEMKVRVGTAVWFDVSENNGKKKATRVRTKEKTTEKAPSRTIVFKPSCKVGGVALFLLRQGETGLEILLGHVPKKSQWESSGYYSELSMRCDYSTRDPPATALRHVESTCLSLPEGSLSSLPSISTYSNPPASPEASCLQSTYVLCSPLTPTLSDACKDYDALRWFSAVEISAKATEEKILQHTEQRVHFLLTNRKVQDALGLALK
eukprot:TRINITY_DN2390_c0_g2_i3.p1 TRINITY_DN2390_c0_g2~~TRINITY_DN2390_c0_g2_i3.p1  ORF type:complete len:240 (+),score=49.71 TRINITY_DN2390_c0_g2_i3:40-759(+)